MRPAILFPLFADVRTLDGVGPKLAQLIGKVAGPRLVDLLFHLPVGLIDRSYRPKLADVDEGRITTVLVNVLDHAGRRDSRHPYRVRCSDETSMLELVFFHGRSEYLARALPPGEKRLVSGRIDRFGSRLQMVHPDYILPPEQADRLPPFEPVYRLTDGLPAKTIFNAEKGALACLPDLPEWQDATFLAARRWSSFKEAMYAAHAPTRLEQLEATSSARARLAYDELLANQLALALTRKRQRSLKGRALTGKGDRGARARRALPFALTVEQERALAEILRDMAAPNRMSRLLQGDVGAGKTIVAMLAMLTAVEAGAQAALMAPTEILARQHFAALSPFAEAAGVSLQVLTGRERASARNEILSALAEGAVDIIVGTHALFSEDVTFCDLGLAVVDEQHRFGVHQRLKLQAKGDDPVDVLVMTATPIPRTLALTAYGDMDVSRITGLPPGRKAVDTRLISSERLDEIVERLRRAIARGQRAFWVCPLVEESEKLDLSAAEERARTLGEILGVEVGLTHGRMKPVERDRAMDRFRAGATRILVATTVIEVGVDVPEATIMVIEHSERFGLAQLHQLRGRVGRGSGSSTCILLYQPPLSELAKARLSTIRETNDGFVIAEEDLRLRGAGELLGTLQSGTPLFRVADLGVHGELLAAARDDARMIVERDPELAGTRGEALRVLLYLFERDEAVRYLRAG